MTLWSHAAGRSACGIAKQRTGLKGKGGIANADADPRKAGRREGSSSENGTVRI